MPKALVVDDSRAMRRILGGILEGFGYTVRQAGHGVEGLEVIERERADGPFELILADWNMPEMNGLEFVRTLRKDARNRRTAVMMVTTETQVEQMVAALAAGASEYVMKPFSKDIIEDKLRMLGLLP
jgi:two-component system, chemotaxis family, chemotaxis protein CheY